MKPLLYVYRVLLTGIHLMRTGEIEANLVTLNEEFRLPYIADLVARKLSGPEKSKLDGCRHRLPRIGISAAAGRIAGRARRQPIAGTASEETRAALNDLLLRVRLTSKEKS